ncbi:MAG TPA: DUF2059 domain-containing protein [Gammaproteobacteria bacterium]|nr:DUF2059 domain-containing protein [Gammaproteobacteria bacterium]
MSKILTIAFIGMLVAIQPAMAADSQPSQASVRKLLQVTHAKKLVDMVPAQVDSMMRASIKAKLGDQKLTAAQQKVLANMRAKLTRLIKQNLNWASLEPHYVDIYQKSFDQREINSMLAFYSSPAGQAVIAKMPRVMKRTMQLVQSQLSVLMPQARQIGQETAKKLEAAGH